MTFRGRIASKVLWLMGAGAAVLVSGPAIASQEMSVNIDGLAAAEKSVLGIKIKAYSLGYSSPIDATSGESTSLILAPVSITKDVDSVTPLLMQGGGTGKVFKTITLTATTTAGGGTGTSTTAVPSLPLVVTITLANARITDWRVVDGKTTASVAPQEQVTFAAQSIAFTHQPLGGDSAPIGTPVTGTVAGRR